MEEILKEIDILITDIQTDTNRSKLPLLSMKLVELSKLYGEAKRELIRTKSDYDREFVMKKEERKMELERLEQKKVDVDSKYKKAKISNVEIEHYTELELLTLKKEQEEPAMIVAYLDPYIRSVYELINSRKFVDRSTIQMEKSFNS